MYYGSADHYAKKGEKSPESIAAQAVFEYYQNNLSLIKQCSSGKELIGQGFESDVDLVIQWNVSKSFPLY